MSKDDKLLALITGASTGIGRELARCCAEAGHELIICANEAEVERTAEELRDRGAHVTAIRADLSTKAGVDELLATCPRPIDLCLANAGRGLGDAFLNQEIDAAEAVIDVNVFGTTYLLHQVARSMKQRKQGRILITGSIAGMMPGSFQAVYNATKAYLDTLSWGLRNELKDHGVSVTCLMPGPTDTEFFRRADMENTDVGEDESKDDPVMVARQGYEAMMAGRSGVTTGFMNKVQSQLSGIVPDSMLASMHRGMAEPHEHSPQPGEKK